MDYSEEFCISPFHCWCLEHGEDLPKERRRWRGKGGGDAQRAAKGNFLLQDNENQEQTGSKLCYLAETVDNTTFFNGASRTKDVHWLTPVLNMWDTFTSGQQCAFTSKGKGRNKQRFTRQLISWFLETNAKCRFETEGKRGLMASTWRYKAEGALFGVGDPNPLTEYRWGWSFS